MGTIIYFVRHADSPYIEGNERSRGLSDKGKLDAIKVESILKQENIDIFISSPYERAIQTVQGLAYKYSKEIIIYEDLRERNIGYISNMDFKEAKKQVYKDINFSFPGGESSLKAQERAVKILNIILEEYKGKKIVIGTHGDIMTLMMNHFDKQYDFEFWEKLSMPDIYKLEFEEKKLVNVTRLWE